MHLYVAYLGGGLMQGRMGEDHEVVMVVATNEVEAKALAKAKWRGDGDPHVDALREIDDVDGFQVLVRQRPSIDV